MCESSLHTTVLNFTYLKQWFLWRVYQKIGFCRVHLPSVGRSLRAAVGSNIQSITSTSSARSWGMAATSVLTVVRSQSSLRSRCSWTNLAIWPTLRTSTISLSKLQLDSQQISVWHSLSVWKQDNLLYVYLNGH